MKSQILFLIVSFLLFFTHLQAQPPVGSRSYQYYQSLTGAAKEAYLRGYNSHKTNTQEQTKSEEVQMSQRQANGNPSANKVILQEGKHYKNRALIVKQMTLPFEADICVAKGYLMIILGDGDGHQSEVYMFEEITKINATSSYCEYVMADSSIVKTYINEKNSLIIEINKNTGSKVLVAETTPYDKPTLRK